jgi:hypothetical protein
LAEESVMDRECKMQNAQLKMKKGGPVHRALFAFSILHSAFCIVYRT